MRDYGLFVWHCDDCTCECWRLEQGDYIVNGVAVSCRVLIGRVIEVVDSLSDMVVDWGRDGMGCGEADEVEGVTSRCVRSSRMQGDGG